MTRRRDDAYSELRLICEMASLRTRVKSYDFNTNINEVGFLNNNNLIDKHIFKTIARIRVHFPNV